MQESFSWEEKEESENFNFNFSKPRGTSSSEIAINMYYVCQHDGHSKAYRGKEKPDHGTNKRYHLGRIKRDTFRPARMS